MSEAIAERTPLPTGTVTFLFTDIEGSTERWEHHREAMKAALARHDDLLGNAITANGGYIFKKMGDAYCAAFRTAPDAVRAAIAAQQALSKEDFSAVNGLRVRMALHTGYAEERDHDYFGPSVNRASRLLSIGHGGQMLVSAAASDLVQGELPAQASLRDSWCASAQRSGPSRASLPVGRARACRPIFHPYARSIRCPTIFLCK